MSSEPISSSAQSARKNVYTYIASPERLQAAVKALEPAERLAVDTEFVREKYYYPRLEIIQISDSDRIYLFDAQALKDLSPLAGLLADESRLKLFHAADQDLEILGMMIGVVPEPVFDMQVAAALLGYGAQISLSNLVKNVLDRSVAGSQSISDWSERPLNDAQLRYAASDVEHLHDLHDRLVAALEERGRMDWYHDEQADRLAAAKQPSPPDDEIYKRVKDWVSLKTADLAILRELAAWREEEARRRNVPRRKVFSDEGLIDIARLKPTSLQKAKKSRRINPGYFKQHYDALMAAIERARACPKDQWPEKPAGERIDLPAGLLELCQALLRTEAERLELASSVVAKTSDLQQLIVNREQLDPQKTPLLHGWRWEVAGRKLVDLLDGRIRVRVGKEGRLVFEDY